MNALTIKNLSFSYSDNVKAIDNVTLEIEKGTYVSLLGHNGSGKSTLAKLIVGLLPFNEGEIHVSDIKLSKENLRQLRSKIAIVFQNPDNQFIGITVEDDIAFSLENRCVSREEMKLLVREYAEKVGMIDYLKKEPAYLSGGQKQRVAIADALVINPEILILDEATSMLDPQGKREILDLVKKMREDNPNLTVISVTHDVEEAYLSDKIALLDKGQLVAYTSPKELFNNQRIIEQYHLDIPFEVRLKNEIKNLDIKISDDDSLDELGDKICQ